VFCRGGYDTDVKSAPLSYTGLLKWQTTTIGVSSWTSTAGQSSVIMNATFV